MSVSKLQQKNLVAQHNNIIEGRYYATKNELTLLIAMISLINPHDKEFLTFSVTVDELARILMLDKKSALREFKKISTRLLKRVIEVETEDGWVMFQWVSKVILKGNVVILRFHDDLKPYLLELKKTGNFTQYRLGIIVNFRSLYTVRIYQVLRAYYCKKIYTFEFSIDEFRKMMLGAKDTKTYPVFYEFKRKVITKAQLELNKKNEATGFYTSDLGFDLATRRTGRKISHLIFTIKTQQTKPVPTAKTEIAINSNAPSIILAYETIGVMRKTVKPYLEQRGEQALQYTLNKFNDDKAKGKITKSEQGYLAYLLRVNAGQETTQDQEREQKAKNKECIKEKKAQEQALEAAYIEERNLALKGFFDTLEEGELEYIILAFEASKLFEERIKSWPMLFTLYNMPDGVGMNDPDVKNYFHAFVIDQHLDKVLNNFAKWKEKNANKHSIST
jgi:plasmid replication initiation protein